MKVRILALWSMTAASLVLIAASVYIIPGVGTRSHITGFEPATGRPGDLITAYGERLDRARVEGLYLTTQDRTALVRILEQNDVSISFRIPEKLASGRYRALLVPVGRPYQTLEQLTTLSVRQSQVSAFQMLDR